MLVLQSNLLCWFIYVGILLVTVNPHKAQFSWPSTCPSLRKFLAAALCTSACWIYDFLICAILLNFSWVKYRCEEQSARLLTGYRGPPAKTMFLLWFKRFIHSHSLHWQQALVLGHLKHWYNIRGLTCIIITRLALEIVFNFTSPIQLKKLKNKKVRHNKR